MAQLATRYRQTCVVRLLVLSAFLIWIPAGSWADEPDTVIYADYEVSIKKGTRGKRSGELGKSVFALPDHDVVSIKINLEPRTGAGVQSWPSSKVDELTEIVVVEALPGEFVLEDGQGNTYNTVSKFAKDETGARQYSDPVQFHLKSSGQQALMWPNWLWFDIPKEVPTGQLTLRLGDQSLGLDSVETVVRECTSRRLKGGTCDYALPADSPSAFVTFRAVKKSDLFKDHRAHYSVYPSSCHTKMRDRIGYILGSARYDIFGIRRYQARIQAGEPVILSAGIVDPCPSITNEDDRRCSFVLELTLQPEEAYEVRSEILGNRCLMTVHRVVGDGFETVESEEIPAKFGGKPNCKKYLKSLESN